MVDITVNNDESVFNMEELKMCLQKENLFLTALVDKIPSKLYFGHEIQEKITAERHSFMDKVFDGLKRKSGNQTDFSAKSKHKRARLDPFIEKSVSQIHDELSKKKKKKKKKSIHDPSASLTRAANIEELQRRLQERIDSLQAQRKATQNDTKKKEKIKKRMKKLKAKQKGNLIKPQDLNENSKLPEKKGKDKSSEKPVFNKEGNFIFSKFDFSADGLEEDTLNKKKKQSNKRKIEKTKALIKKTEKVNEKLEKLKTVDPETAESVTEKLRWKKAIQKTEGVKVKDDPKLLKKSLKREEKKKKKSAKAWKERNEETDKRKQARQDKRNKNIKQKKKDKLERKLKLAKKKGRFIPNI